MKKLLLGVLVIGLGVFVISCNEDDEKESFQNYVKYDGKKYELIVADSYINDYGYDGYWEESNYDFYFKNIDEGVSVYVELYQSNTSFTGGSFTADGANYWESDDLDVGEVNVVPSTGTVTATDLGNGVWEVEFMYDNYEGYFKGELTIYDYSQYRTEGK